MTLMERETSSILRLVYFLSHFSERTSATNSQHLYRRVQIYNILYFEMRFLRGGGAYHHYQYIFTLLLSDAFMSEVFSDHTFYHCSLCTLVNNHLSHGTNSRGVHIFHGLSAPNIYFDFAHLPPLRVHSLSRSFITASIHLCIGLPLFLVLLTSISIHCSLPNRALSYLTPVRSVSASYFVLSKFLTLILVY